MSGISKRVSGSWVSGDYGIMGTSTDTITTLPAVLYPNDITATVGLKGNMSQSGTPTPQNPIQPQETGERTGNLLNPSDILYNTQYDTAFNPSDTLNCSNYIPVTGGTYLRTLNNVAIGNWYYEFDANKNYLRMKSPGEGVPMVISNDASYIVFNFSKTVDINKYMFARTSTPIPYEPYGYKIPISSASTTTPVYLGEVESTRKIKKYVFDGTEDWGNSVASDIFGVGNLFGNTPFIPQVLALCTEYTYNSRQSGYANGLASGEFALQKFTSGSRDLFSPYFRNNNYTTVDQWKAYLAQQYAAGTPVTVWYVLATETTGIVNEPLRKIGDYADTVSGITIPTIAGADSFDVLTTLKPSEVTVNYKGWHPVQSVHERENGVWT